MNTHFEERLAELRAAQPAAPEPAVASPPQAEQFLPTLWAFRTLIDTRKRARLRGFEYALTPRAIVAMLERQGYCCAVSGITFSAKRTRAEAHKRPFWPSIDRIDCTKGYVEGNVRIVCVAINTLLQDWGDEVWTEVAAAARRGSK